jgi:putative metallohydrolase (TIGR04338 family)
VSSPKAYYDAEHALTFVLDNGGTYEFFGSKLTLPIEARFGRIEDIDRYLARVYDHLDLPGTPPKVVEKRGQRSAHYSGWTREIHIPTLTGWAMRETVVLHELAHHLTPEDTVNAGHGDRFCSCLVWLITRCIAPEAGLILSAEYGERGVHVTPFAL